MPRPFRITRYVTPHQNRGAPRVKTSALSPIFLAMKTMTRMLEIAIRNRVILARIVRLVFT